MHYFFVFHSILPSLEQCFLWSRNKIFSSESCHRQHSDPLLETKHKPDQDLVSSGARLYKWREVARILFYVTVAMAESATWIKLYQSKISLFLQCITDLCLRSERVHGGEGLHPVPALCPHSRLYGPHDQLPPNMENKVSSQTRHCCTPALHSTLQYSFPYLLVRLTLLPYCLSHMNLYDSFLQAFLLFISSVQKFKCVSSMSASSKHVNRDATL